MKRTHAPPTRATAIIQCDTIQSAVIGGHAATSDTSSAITAGAGPDILAA